VELIPELVLFGASNLAKYKFQNAQIVNAGKDLGLPEDAPFDKILVSAECLTLPEATVKQLKVGGILVIPVLGAIWKVTRVSEIKTDVEKFEGFAFVSLIQ